MISPRLTLAISLGFIAVAGILAREEVMFIYRLGRAVRGGEWEVTWK